MLTLVVCAAPADAQTPATTTELPGGRMIYFTKPAVGTPQANRYATMVNSMQNKADAIPKKDEEFRLPTADMLFRAESEEQFIHRLEKEAKVKDPNKTVELPPLPILSKEKIDRSSYTRRTLEVEPMYVCHRRLYFEEMNTERYGWDLGFVQPIVSSATFFKDLVLLPHNFASNMCNRYDCSAGKLLPGDQVPYLLYPPKITISGGLAEAGSIIGLAAIIP